MSDLAYITVDYKTTPSSAKSPKIGTFERVLAWLLLRPILPFHDRAPNPGFSRFGLLAVLESTLFETGQPSYSRGLVKLAQNKRLSQQPALGALIFLRSSVAGKANFCSQLLASLVHFTVIKSQAILIIRLGVAEVISATTWYLLPDEISTSLDMFKHNNFACGLQLIDRRFDSNDVSVECKSRGRINKNKKAKKHQCPIFPDQYLPTPLEHSENLLLLHGATKFSL